MIIVQFALLLVGNDFPVCDNVGFQQYPCVVFGESLYYAFWSDLRSGSGASIYAARVTTDGTVLDGGGRFLYHGNTTQGPRAAFDGQNFLAVFRDSC